VAVIQPPGCRHSKSRQRDMQIGMSAKDSALRQKGPQLLATQTLKMLKKKIETTLRRGPRIGRQKTPT